MGAGSLGWGGTPRVQHPEPGALLCPQSEHFKTTSQKVARKYWWKNLKLLLILGLVGAIILILIILLVSGVIPT
nr:PREDICTED: vesicle-associated membrane protein 8 [Struthio camelus australis]